MGMRVGFIGLGTMGEPMAANLLSAGFPVQVLAHRNRLPIERLVARGATEGATPRDLGQQNDLVVLCVTDDEAVREVTLGVNGLVHAANPSLVVVDCSTISPLASQEIAGALQDVEITMLDAPISGGQSGAQAGTLAVMVGGPRVAFEHALPVLEAMGSAVTHVGDNGSALIVKLCNNLIVGAMLTAISEAFALADKAGVDSAILHEVLSKATARSWLLQERVPATLLSGNMEPGFKLALMRKDMGLAQDLGKAMEVPAFVTGLVHQLYVQAQGMGLGDIDCFGISKLYNASE